MTKTIYDKCDSEFLEYGWQQKEFSIEDAARGANPYYGHPSHINNCQCCVWAYEMRRRGFDVIAGPQQLAFDQPHEMVKIVNGGKWISVTRSGITRLMNRWGISSRAILYLAWGRGPAHVINIENTKKGLVYIDPQSGMIVDGKRYLNRAKNMRLMRVDDKEVTDKINKLVCDPPDIMPEWVARMITYHC